MNALQHLPWYRDKASRKFSSEITLAKNLNIWCGGYPYRIISKFGFQANIEESALASMHVKIDKERYIVVHFKASGLYCETVNYGSPYKSEPAGHYSWHDIKQHIKWLNRFRDAE